MIALFFLGFILQILFNSPQRSSFSM
jgi:hypothetical protein